MSAVTECKKCGIIYYALNGPHEEPDCGQYVRLRADLARVTAERDAARAKGCCYEPEQCCYKWSSCRHGKGVRAKPVKS
jgi:hypothetical protein